MLRERTAALGTVSHKWDPGPPCAQGPFLSHVHPEPPRSPHDTTVSLSRARPRLSSAWAFSREEAPVQAHWTAAGVAWGHLPCQEGASASLSRSCPLCRLVPSFSARWPPRRRVRACPPAACRPPGFSSCRFPSLSGRRLCGTCPSHAASIRPPHRCRQCGSVILVA